MTAQAQGRGSFPWRIVGWGLAAGLLLLPAVAMQFTAEVNWDGFDFLFAGVLIGGVGLALEGAARLSPNRFYRAGVAFALAAAFCIVWINAAVGMIGSEDNAHNLFFLGVILVALVGALLGRMRASGMARAMTAAAVAHLAVAAAGLLVDVRGALLSALFAVPWLISAALFRRAARAA